MNGHGERLSLSGCTRCWFKNTLVSVSFYCSILSLVFFIRVLIEVYRQIRAKSMDYSNPPILEKKKVFNLIC